MAPRKIALVFILLLSPSWLLAQDFDKGWAAFQAGDFVTVLEEWRPLGEQGDTVAQYALGTMYANGEGVLQDYAEAVGWYDAVDPSGPPDGRTLGQSDRHAAGPDLLRPRRQDRLYRIHDFARRLHERQIMARFAGADQPAVGQTCRYRLQPEWPRRL
jgi:hypothetical protein